MGFRWWTRSRALELGLTGWARNCADGRVEIVAQGPRLACEHLLELLNGSSTPDAAPGAAPGAAVPGASAPGEITGIVSQWTTPPSSLTGFTER